MIDTNVIISAVLNPSDRASEALIKAMYRPFEPAVCSCILDELHIKFEEKFPGKILELEAFLYHMLRAVVIIPTPETPYPDEETIHSTNSRLIFRAAMNTAASYILTSDRNFLESGIKFPYIVSVQEFLAL